MTQREVDLIRRKKEGGYGMTNSEIKALHDFDRIPRKPILDVDRPYTPIVNQLIDRVHTIRPDWPDLVSASSASSVKLPFQPVISGTSATITYGTINSIPPTNIGSTFTIPTTGTRYLVLTVTASSGDVVSSSLSVDTTTPTIAVNTLGNPPNTFKVLLYVVVNQTLFRIIGPGSVTALSKEVFRVQKSMTTPDMLPYDSYYNWDIGNA